MPMVEEIESQLLRLRAVDGWRYAIGLRVRFANPTLLYQTYPEAWLTEYAARGLRFSDPTIRWGMAHTGVIAWSDLAGDDPDGVLDKARAHGLCHGIAVSVGDAATRSLGFFARTDRALDPTQTALAQDVVHRLHAATATVADMDEASLARLRDLG